MNLLKSILARVSHNFSENKEWLIELWNDDHNVRDKLFHYYRWHFKELVLCFLLALLLTRVDKIQQFFSAFSTDIKTGQHDVLGFAVVFGLNGVVIFWLCYVCWHKPAKIRLSPRWRIVLLGNKNRDDFGPYYQKPGNAWRVAMVSSLPMLLVSGTLSLALLSDNPLENRTPTPLSLWLDANSFTVLFCTAILYLIIGSLIRPHSKIPPDHRKAEEDSQQKMESAQHLSAAGYDNLLDNLWKIFQTNFWLLPVFMFLLGTLLWFYQSYGAPAHYFALIIFTLTSPLIVAFFLNSLSECLIIEKKKEKEIEREKREGLLKRNVKHEPKFEKWYDRLLSLSYFASIVIFVLCNNKSVTSHELFSLWMFPIAMLLFIFIAYYQLIDLLVYNMTVLRIYTLVIVLFFLVLFLGQREHYRLKFHGEVPISSSLPRATLESYFLTWTLDRFYTDAAKDTMDVFLIAAEGGGSRSGAWTSAMLTHLDSVSGGRFRRQCFAISGVSGGSVGVAATLALWDNAEAAGIKDESLYVDNHRAKYIDKIFQRNYISTSLAGIFFYDALQQIPGVHWLYGVKASERFSRTDRQQDEENDAVGHALRQVFGTKQHIQRDYFKKTNFLSLYYENGGAKLRTHLPLFFPNSCRVEDGRRGLVSPILLDDSQVNTNPKNPFNAAVVDIIGLYCKESSNKAISLGEATSLSELFPFVNSTVFINKNTGSFMDGGAYENLGLSTLYEIRRAVDTICRNPDPVFMKSIPDSLRQNFRAFLKKIDFKMLLIYNINNHGNEKQAAYYNNWQLFDPITALMQTPFGGHTDYIYHRVKSEQDQNDVIDLPLLVSSDLGNVRSDKIVMSRWLSKYEMSEIMKRTHTRADSNFCKLYPEWCTDDR